MARWTCPACEREFARERQAHTCAPAISVGESFAGRPPVQRAIYDEVVRYLSTLGPLHVDPVRVGVFLKRHHKLAEVRPMARALSLNVVLPRTVDHPRVVRTMRISAGRVVHVLRLREVAEVDGQLRDWLTEAYDAAG